MREVKLSLLRHARGLAMRIEQRELGTRTYSATAQGADVRRLVTIADAFGIDVDPWFVDGFTAWRIYFEIDRKVNP